MKMNSIRNLNYLLNFIKRIDIMYVFMKEVRCHLLIMLISDINQLGFKKKNYMALTAGYFKLNVPIITMQRCKKKPKKKKKFEFGVNCQ